jgi:glycosyltransferase involved in cell wall biosynthesis
MFKLSIVTISFNQAEYLEEAIKSVLGQDYPSIEYIVVDPGSSDGSREIIERYRKRIGKIVYEPDKGPADGLNHGFAHATGEVFAYLNADDVLLPGSVSSAMKALEDPSLAVVYADGYFIDSDGKILRRCFSNTYSVWRYALGGAIIMQQSSFWRADWHRRMGGFNVENRTWWDGEFFFRIALAGGKLRHIREYWSYFRIHGESITGSGRTNDKYVAHERQVLAPHVKRYGPLLPLARLGAQLIKHLEDPRIIVARLGERFVGPPVAGKASS